MIVTDNRRRSRRRCTSALFLAIGISVGAACTSDDDSAGTGSSAAPGPITAGDSSVRDSSTEGSPAADAAPESDTAPETGPPPATQLSTPGSPSTESDAGDVEDDVEDDVGDNVEDDACAAPAETASIATTDLGNDRDHEIVSFDGTIIRAHWFPLPGGSGAPTVLMGPGWGSGGDTDVDEVGRLGAITIGALRDAGYNVLTWDPRGFGDSTGTVTVDSVDYEGRDVQHLIDWVAGRPEASLDATGDPLMGMVGGSYGGGIQLVIAAVDCRIDAIVPVIAWNSLTTSLYKNDTPKLGWANLLITATFGADLDPTITRAQTAANATGSFDPADAAWFADRGPGGAVARITVPTLLIQGTVDTLFTLDEAIANYELLRASEVPVAMLWFCGGHGICLTDEGDPTQVVTSAVAWLDRYVKDDSSAETGAGFTFVDQDGTTYTADEYGAATGDPLTSSGSGTLSLIAEGGAGPATVDESNGLLGRFISQITPGIATNAVNVAIRPPAADVVVVGAGELTMRYVGTPGIGDRPARVFAQLVDDATGLVIGNQITPIEVVLDGQPHTSSASLESIGFTAHPSAGVTLQIVATTVAYAQPQLGGSINFDQIDVSLPVMDGLESSR